MSPCLAIVAGEASGDLHGAALIQELRCRLPDLEVFGIGGLHLRQAGVDIRFDSSGWGAIGIVESLRLVPKLLWIFARWKQMLLKAKPDGIILVDFGAFNIRVARFAHSQGMRIFYYFPPGSWRKEPRNAAELASLTDLIVTPFPWHARALQRAGANAHFFGHPALDVLHPMPKKSFCQEIGLDPAKPVVALLPGSRTAEVAHILKVMLAAATLIRRTVPDAQFLIPSASEQISRHIRSQVEAWDQNQKAIPSIRILEGRAHDCLQAADLSLTVSGTATLEAAILHTPMIILYRGSWLMELEYIIRKPKFDHIGMPNILADRRICPELIQNEATPERIAALALELITDPARSEAMRFALQEAVVCLGEPGAIRKTADLLMKSWFSSPSSFKKGEQA